MVLLRNDGERFIIRVVRSKKQGELNKKAEVV